MEAEPQVKVLKLNREVVSSLYFQWLFTEGLLGQDPTKEALMAEVEKDVDKLLKEYEDWKKAADAHAAECPNCSPVVEV